MFIICIVCLFIYSDSADDEDPYCHGNVTYAQVYASNRRHVTEEEIVKAYDLAKAAATPEDFVVDMKPTHVYKKFYLVNVNHLPFDVYSSSRCKKFSCL